MDTVSPSSQRARFRERLFFGFLYALVLFSALLLVAHGSGMMETLWGISFRVYLYLLLFHTWFIFLLLFWNDAHPRTYPTYGHEKIAVVIPCFNEPEPLLKRALQALLAARGNKEIFIVNDGSTNGIRAYLDAIDGTNGISVHHFAVNQGKRAAMYYAITHMVPEDAAFVVSMDSDTVFAEDALIRIVEPLLQRKIGGASGDVKLLNEKENLLTRMISSYYWTSLHIQRKSQSVLGMVGCCSGAIAAYKAPLAKRVMREFVNQKLFGKRCTHSEDRHLTNLVLENGYDVVFVPEAVAYTESPSTLRGFMRQQLRWRRGFFQESFYTLSYSLRRKPLLFFDVLIWDIILPLLSFGIAFLVLATIVANPAYFLVAILPAWIILMAVRNLPMLFFAKENVPGLFLFILYSNFVAYWQGIFALFTLKNKKWVTR